MSKRLLWLALLALSNITFAQTPTTENPTKVDYGIPSPNTAAFNKYGNTPVNLFNGVPNISVSLYTVPVGKHSLPISISYHAGGIRVDDISSDVGLGWNLAAGYKISRVQRGKADEGGYVGHNDAAKIINSNSGLSNNFTADTFKAVADGIWDTEPDEFNFSIGGGSGKFILAPDKTIVMPDQDIKVSYTTVFGGHFVFILTDAQGIQYHFNEFSTTSTDGCGDAVGSSTEASSWSISKIIYPDTRDSITFTYTDEFQEITTMTEKRNYDYDLNFLPVKIFNCPVNSHIVEKKLTVINFPNGRIQFTYTVPKFELANSLALSKMEVFDQQGTSFRKILLGYNYYNAAANSTYNLSKKLRLDSVYTLTPDGLISDKYLFAYNGDDIPAYQSKAKDHWGFYNAASNTSLIPSFNSPVNFSGGNREPNPYMSAMGVLNKITYPAGGSTLFEYENNDAGQDCTGGNFSEPIYSNVTYSCGSNCQFTIAPGYKNKTVVFTAPSDQTANVIVDLDNGTCLGNSRKFTITDLNTNQIVAQGPGFGPGSGTGAGSLNLISGHQYSIYTEAECRYAEANVLNCNTYITVKVTTNTLTGYKKNLLAGGLRVKKITDFDPYSTVTNVKSYSYQMPGEADRSSGIMMFKPRYDYVYVYNVNKANPQPGTVPVPIIVGVTSYCYTAQANNTAQNNENTVAYRYVKETIGASGEGGSVLYNFSTPYRSCEVGYPFAPATSEAHRNGQLLSQKTFDKDGVLKQSITNVYSFLLSDKIPGWKTAYSVVKAPTEPETNQIKANKFVGYKYSYLSEKIRLEQTTIETSYPINSINQTQSYTYQSNASYYPYQTVTINSDGKTTTSVNWLSSDFNVLPTTGLTGATAALRFMQDNHMTNYPVESYNLVDGSVTGASITEYFLNENFGYKKILPAQLFKLASPVSIDDYAMLSRQISLNASTLEKDARYLSEVRYSGYNEKGNPAVLKGQGGKSISLIWGYKNNFPIAKILNDSAYKCGFTSFEADAKGNWIFNEAFTVVSPNLTGKKSYYLPNGEVYWDVNATGGLSPITHTGFPTPGKYIVSYWKKDGNVLVNGAAPTSTGSIANGWTYCEHLLSDPATVVLSGSGYIDELRFYPEQAKMESYTYDPMIGITSMSNTSGHLSFYEYDKLGRLIVTKDEQGNILKRTSYKYQEAQ